MEKNKELYVTIEERIEESVEELDIDIKESFGFVYDAGMDFNVINTKGEFDSFYYIPLDIESAIKIITDMKAKGMTHIAFNHDGDHYGYEFFGTKLRPSTPEEISLNIEITNAHKAKFLKVKALEDEIRRLKNS